METILAAINWNVSPEIFSIGFIKLRWYGLLFALSFILGYQILEWIFKKEKKPAKDLERLTIILILSVVIGARLGHTLFYNPGYYLANPVEILKVWEGGLASHGAAFGILIGIWIFVRTRPHMSFFWVFDRVAIVAALAGFFIRLGNFMNSEIIGTPADLPWAVIFHRAETVPVPRHPVQMYESLVFLALFVILFLWYKKKGSETAPGSLIGSFIVVYFGARFFLEFVKSEQVEYAWNLPIHMGQILSIPIVIVGAYFLWRSRKHKPGEIKEKKVKGAV